MTDWLGKTLQEALNPIANSIFGYALIYDKNGKCLEKVDTTGYLQDESLLHELSTVVSRCHKPMTKRLDGGGGLTPCIVPFGDYFLVTGTDHIGFNDRFTSPIPLINNRHNGAKYTFTDIIGESSLIVKCKEEAQKAAQSCYETVILGETGTGKELFAQAIHNASDRWRGPFIAVNCSSFPSSLVESYLFGYEGGAFTGAKKEGSQGIFEQAQGGTLFLDEVSEMNIEFQAKLLRSLQEREVVRVGGHRVIPVDVRIIASSNRDLYQMVNEGSFRRDLFFRLFVYDIQLPPLRTRNGDIQLLINHYLGKNGLQESIYFKQPCLDRLIEYPWPGNVRELINCLKRSVISVREQTMDISALPPYIRDWGKEDEEDCQQIELNSGRGLEDTLQNMEKSIIENVLSKTNNNRSKAAQKLGISSSTLWRKMKEHSIK